MKDVCEVCGNSYDKMMTVFIDTRKHKFDCFECAIQALAPTCHHCGVRIVGHGLEEGDNYYCCAHCARVAGQHNFVDHISEVRVER